MQAVSKNPLKKLNHLKPLMEMDTFMGHPIKYWIELEKHAQELNAVELLSELAEAYAKVGYYEKRIKEMSSFLVRNLPQD